MNNQLRNLHDRYRCGPDDTSDAQRRTLSLTSGLEQNRLISLVIGPGFFGASSVRTREEPSPLEPMTGAASLKQSAKNSGHYPKSGPISTIRRHGRNGRYWTRSGHRLGMALDRSVANDPNRTWRAIRYRRYPM